MRIWIVLGLMAGLTAGAGAAPVKPRHPIKKFAVVVLAKDAARAADVEAGVKSAMAQKGIQADGFRTLFSTRPADVPDTLARLKAEHYEGLLCIAPRKTIQITKADKTSRVSDRNACLTAFVTGKWPSGDPIDVNPFEQEPSVEATAAYGTPSRTPIPTNSGGVAYRINKGKLRLFDIHSDRLLWEGNLNVKLPSDIQTGLETTLVVREITNALDKSGLFSTP